MFWFRNKNFIFKYALLSGGLCYIAPWWPSRLADHIAFRNSDHLIVALLPSSRQVSGESDNYFQWRHCLRIPKLQLWHSFKISEIFVWFELHPSQQLWSCGDGQLT